MKYSYADQYSRKINGELWRGIEFVDAADKEAANKIVEAVRAAGCPARRVSIAAERSKWVGGRIALYLIMGRDKELTGNICNMVQRMVAEHEGRAWYGDDEEAA